MSHDESPEPTTSEPFEVGAEMSESEPAQPPHRSRLGRRTAVVSAVAVALAAGGGAVAMAGGGSGSTPAAGTPTPAPSNAPGEGRPGGGHHGGPGMGFDGPRLGLRAGPDDALHGELTVNTGTAATPTYSVVEVQTGTVSAVGGGSLTVKSADGFTRTYVLPVAAKVDRGHGTVGEVKTGDSVGLTASVSGSAVTVAELEDRTRDTAGPMGRPGRPGGPAPRSSAPTTAS